MRSAFVLLKRFAIYCHRWMGVAFCLLFAWWFLSGIFMMYWDYPGVSAADKLTRAQAIDASKIHVSAQEAWAKSGRRGRPSAVSIAMLDGRPVYRFNSGLGDATTFYADNGAEQAQFPDDMLLRLATFWTSQAETSAKTEEIKEADQWTIGLRSLLPLRKYSFPDGQQVYLSPDSGEVVQYTTTASRIGAYLGPIPHWLYFTPLRLKEQLWTNAIIYASGVGTIMALLGLIVGIWMYSPLKRYRFEGRATTIPYAGQKRLHMILGLFFGIVTCTWAFSGMLSMDPPFLRERLDQASGGDGVTERIAAALGPEPFRFAAYEAKSPAQALAQLGGVMVKRLDFTSFDGQPVYLAAMDARDTRVVPLAGDLKPEFDRDRILDMVARAAQPDGIAEKRLMTEYDAYYLDRHREHPLPVLFVKLANAQHTQLYIDPRTGTVVGEHSDDDSFTTRWLYHGLHSFDYPWLYNHRPAWDIVVLTLMLGGLSLCVTSVLIGWRMLRRKFMRIGA